MFLTIDMTHSRLPIVPTASKQGRQSANVCHLFFSILEIPCTGNPHWMGRLRTVDILLLTSLDRLIFKFKISSTFVIKQAISMRRSTVLSLPLQVVLLAQSDHITTLSTVGVTTQTAHKSHLPQARRAISSADVCLETPIHKEHWQTHPFIK